MSNPRKAYMAAYAKEHAERIEVMRLARVKKRKEEMQERIDEALRAEVRREHRELNEDADE